MELSLILLPTAKDILSAGQMFSEYKYSWWYQWHIFSCFHGGTTAKRRLPPVSALCIRQLVNACSLRCKLRRHSHVDRRLWSVVTVLLPNDHLFGLPVTMSSLRCPLSDCIFVMKMRLSLWSYSAASMRTPLFLCMMELASSRARNRYRSRHNTLITVSVVRPGCCYRSGGRRRWKADAADLNGRRQYCCCPLCACASGICYGAPVVPSNSRLNDFSTLHFFPPRISHRRPKTNDCCEWRTHVDKASPLFKFPSVQLFSPLLVIF